MNAYAHMVPSVVKMGSSMLQKCTGNSEAMNEVLQLFSFIVEKYASMSLTMPNSD